MERFYQFSCALKIQSSLKLLCDFSSFLFNYGVLCPFVTYALIPICTKFAFSGFTNLHTINPFTRRQIARLFLTLTITKIHPRNQFLVLRPTCGFLFPASLTFRMFPRPHLGVSLPKIDGYTIVVPQPIAQERSTLSLFRLIE